MFYLYVKTHNVTGLKYLGMTSRDDVHTYRGSGKYWTQHIEKHGYDDVTTDVLGVYETPEALGVVSLRLSEEWNIVDSPDFANLMVETGEGAPLGNTYGKSNKGSKRTNKQKEVMSISKTGTGLGNINAKGAIHTAEMNAAKALRVAKSYIATDPEGKVHHLTNLKEFCKDHNLDAKGMSAAANGRRKHHKDWTCIHAPKENNGTT
jgi:hypothetical protein